jgi:hypothetical protein
VKFVLFADGTKTCVLPPAIIAVTRTQGNDPGPVNETVYNQAADSGSNFRIDDCQYIYNLSSSALGEGSYQVDILLGGAVVGGASFKLN